MKRKYLKGYTDTSMTMAGGELDIIKKYKFIWRS
jgi:hypothetical protein